MTYWHDRLYGIYLDGRGVEVLDDFGFLVYDENPEARQYFTTNDGPEYVSNGRFIYLDPL